MKRWAVMTALLLRLAALLLAAPVVTSLVPSDAKAAVVCSVVNSGMAFGTSLTGTGTVNWSCTGYNTSATTFNLCVRLGTPSWPGTASQPRLLNGSNRMNYNVYRNAARTTVWTAATPLVQSVTVGAGIGTTVTGTFTFYGLIPGGQTSPAGNYAAFFYNTRLGFATNAGTNCQTNRNGNSGLDFTLPITATKINACTVDALADANLGNVAAGASVTPGSTTIRVLCPTGTAYNIGLLPSNGNMGGAGVMLGTGSNPDTVGYQLRRTSGTGPAWGNTATVSSVGNGVSGTGTGSDQDYPVFASVPNTNVRPDDYSDTVTVTVHY
jgi:spore coat protein U-like protein